MSEKLEGGYLPPCPGLELQLLRTLLLCENTTQILWEKLWGGGIEPMFSIPFNKNHIDYFGLVSLFTLNKVLLQCFLEKIASI